MGWLGHPDCRDPAILLGDLNATSHYASYRILAARLQDAQRQPAWGLSRDGARARATVRTFPSRLPMLRIDHCFVTRSVHILGVQAPSGALARAASDHLPLVVDVRLSPAEAGREGAVTEL